MRTIAISTSAVRTRVNRRTQVLRVLARVRRSTTLSILLNHGVGILCWAGLTLSAMLSFVFGIMLMNGWSILLSVVLACVASVIFTAKEEYDEYSIKEAIEAIALGRGGAK